MFTVGIPALLLYLNCMGVLWYANFECVLGFMKITLVLASFLAMVIINNLGEIDTWAISDLWASR